jgi:hypothetical protein
MRAIGWLASTTALAAMVAFSRPASADSMDPALARLVTDASCQATGANPGKYYNPASGFARCGIDNLAFAKLVAQYGFAIAPSGMHSARTTGFGGFELAIEADYTKIDSSADYWKNGTQGADDTSTKKSSIRNPSPDSMLQVYNLKIRKGFPFGFELQGNVGYMAHTSIITIGSDVRWSIFEGFRTGIPAIFPEVAVGGSVRTITGTPELQLTVAGFDAQISKPLPVSGTVVVTPYAGYQWIRIFGDSGLVDLTPNTDAVNYCGYGGSNTPATPDPAKAGKGYDGQPVCSRGSSADFNNTAVFDPVRLTRHRLNFGAQLRYQMIKFGAHFSTDLVSAADANQGAAYEAKVTNADGSTKSVNKFEGVAKQWTLAFDLGAVF